MKRFLLIFSLFVLCSLVIALCMMVSNAGNPIAIGKLFAPKPVVPPAVITDCTFGPMHVDQSSAVSAETRAAGINSFGIPDSEIWRLYDTPTQLKINWREIVEQIKREHK